MNKKILAFLLALVLVVSTAVVGIVSASAEDFDATITYNGKDYGANIGDNVTFAVYYTFPTARVINTQCVLSFDSAVLDAPSEDDLLDDCDVYFPVVEDDMIIVQTFDGSVVTYNLNCSKNNGYNFKSEAGFLVFEMPVIAKGKTELKFDLQIVQYKVENNGVSSLENLVTNNEVVNDDFTLRIELLGATEIVEKPTEASTEAPSEDPTAPPEVPTEAPEVPTDAPEVPTDAPEVPTDAPEVPTDAPEVPTDAPEVPTDAPEVPTDAPEVPTDAPEVSTDAPTEASTIAPEDNIKYYISINGGEPIELKNNGDGTYSAECEINANDDVVITYVGKNSGGTVLEGTVIDSFEGGKGTVVFNPVTEELAFDPIPEETEAPNAPQDPTKAEDDDETDDATQAPEAATSADSDTNNNSTNANNAAVQTGSTSVVMMFFIVLIMAVGVVFFARKKAMNK